MISPKVAPEMRTILEAIASMGGPAIETVPVAQGRQMARGLIQLAGEPEAVARIENRTADGRSGAIPIRIYWPEGSGPFPGMVYIHGGGWVICDLETHDNVCRTIAKRAGAVVVAVDYRLAPEHQFPAALDDCVEVTQWVAANAAALNIDAKRLVVAGDSAGANMATVVAAKARDGRGPAIALQVLVYPATDMSATETPSRQEYAEDHFLTRPFMQWCTSLYLGNGTDKTNPDASPAFIKDLRGMPPALVITAECDPLRDEGEAYAARLKDAGSPVTLTRYDGMIHPFLNFLGASASAQKAVDQIAAAVRSLR